MKRREIAVVVIAAVIFAGAVGAPLWVCLSPARDYKQAEKLAAEGEYEAALAIFTEISGYKDSADQAGICEEALRYAAYSEAVSLAERGNAAQAADIFRSLGGYRDSGSKLKNCEAEITEDNYKEAVRLLDRGCFKEAEAVLEQLTGYKDSQQLLADCREALKDEAYSEAEKCIAEGRFEEAEEILQSLEGFRDSEELCAQLVKVSELSEQFAGLSIGDTVCFGIYEQDYKTVNGREDVEWKVIDADDDRLLLLSVTALDGQPYSPEIRDVTWEDSWLRHWLNSAFFDTVFTTEERLLIAEVTTGQGGGEAAEAETKDRIFVLSADEAEKYLAPEDMLCEASSYGRVQIAQSVRVYQKCNWWLRTPGQYATCPEFVTFEGEISSGTERGCKYCYGVRPAIWVYR